MKNKARSATSVYVALADTAFRVPIEKIIPLVIKLLEAYLKYREKKE